MVDGNRDAEGLAVLLVPSARAFTGRAIQGGGDVKKEHQMTETNSKEVALSNKTQVTGLPRNAVKVSGRTATINANESGVILEQFGGSTRNDFNLSMLHNVLAIGNTDGTKDEDAIKSQIIAVSAALAAFKPADEIEGMLAAQAVACHFGAMEAFRRSLTANQPADIASRLRKDGANLARTMTDMIEALDRKRGKGPQVVRVERVVVHEGGQAVVGNVTTGKTGGGAGA